jgi:hypothetical protein
MDLNLFKIEALQTRMNYTKKICLLIAKSKSKLKIFDLKSYIV